jgi:hypothetical protein
MMNALMKRGETLAAEVARRKAREIAARVIEMLGEGSAEAIGANVAIRGRGLMKRWLSEPELRFLSRMLK